MDEPDSVTCLVCEQTGYVQVKDERGYLISHPGRHFPCRIPLELTPRIERALRAG